MPIQESEWQAFNNVTAAKPTTLVSAATIAPASYLTVLTGNTAVVNITPPLLNQVHTIALQFAGTAGVTAAGNIATAKASVVGEIMMLVYNPLIAKYVPVG